MVYEKQISNFTRRDLFYFLSNGLTGKKIASPEEAADFFHTHYRIDGLGWYAALERGWASLTLGATLPDSHYDGAVVPGLSAFFIVAIFGMIAAVTSRDWRHIFHASWLVMFAGLLTGVVNARYRYVFEPFCAIYVLLFADTLWNAVRTCPPQNADFKNAHHRDSVPQRSDHDR
jgi:hypothetical protein